jgi:soluble lytic murein transglycosylase
LAACGIAVGAVLVVFHVGGSADAEPERPDELRGSSGVEDLSEDRPYGLLESDSCDLLCEITQSRDAPYVTADQRVHHPVVPLEPAHGLAEISQSLDAGKCGSDVLKGLDAAPDSELVAWLRVRSLLCQGRRKEARAQLVALEHRGVPGLEVEVRRLRKRLGLESSAPLLPSLSVDGRAYLSKRLAAAGERASGGDVDGALAELDALQAQLRVAAPRRRIARTRGEILQRADRLDEAACSFYRAWTHQSGRARKEMSERLDELAGKGVSVCQVELGERLASEHNALATTKTSKRKAAVERLVRRYGLSGRDRRALDALGRGHVRADARDREGALGPYAAAISGAQHPEIAARARFDRATALRRLDRDKEAIETYLHLVRQAPRSPLAAEALYQAGRLSVYVGRYKEARVHLATMVVSYPDSARIADALWQAGWADWRRGDVPSAVRLFEHLGRHHGAGRDRAGLPFEARALYWRARGLARLGRASEAVDGYRFVMERFPLTYYAALAHHRIASLGVRPEDAVPFLPSLPEPVDPSALADLDAVRVPLHPRLRRGVALWRTGARAAARDELHSQLKFDGVPRGVVEILATLHAVDGNYPAAHWVATRYGDFAVAPYEGNWRLWALAHPVPPKLWKAAHEAGAETGVDPGLAMAIIRHESSYKTKALSNRGAVGVMQLMPGTARNVYRTWYGKAGPSRKGLNHAEANIRSGMAMFALLDHVYSGNTPLMIAAYNAGPGVSARWWRARGDLETDALVEEMTYPGTVAYLKKVLGSWYAYRVLYGDGSPPPIPVTVPDRLEEWERPSTDLVGALDTSQAVE